MAGSAKLRKVLTGVSLYRTWRPRTFADLVGQDAVVRTLTSALESGKLAHAYLFSGPRGSGKTSSAKILARCIDCINGPTAHPDNTCENCLAIIAGTALDVLEIDAASNRGIDEIRALRDAVKFAPATMRMKVYIIDEAHMLTKEGANAFLKTLEEPPPHAVFILATTEPEKLPVTILSRCQRYAFRRISIPTMIDRMREIAKAEKLDIDEAALSAIAYRADGGLRDALTMLEQAAAFADGKITAQTVDLAFGATGRNYAGAILDQLIARDASGMLKTIDDASDAGTDMQVLIRGLIGEFRHLLVARIDAQLLSGDLAPEDAQIAQQRSEKLAQAEIVNALRLLSDALTTARSSGNPRLELETALLRYVYAAQDESYEALNARIAALEERGIAASTNHPEVTKGSEPPDELEERKRVDRPPLDVAPAASPPPKHAQTGPITIQKIKAAWESIITKVATEKQSLRGELRRAMPDAIDDGTLVVKVPSALSVDLLKDSAALVSTAISEALGASLNVRFAAGAGSPARAKGGTTARTAARLQNGSDAFGGPAGDDPEELFSYLNERIK